MSFRSSHTTPNYRHWLQQLQAQLRETHQRKLLCVEGDMSWCDDIAHICQLNEPNFLAISDRCVGYQSTAYSKVETLLGTEAALVIVDLFEGINPDVVCVASGLLVQGGLLLMMSDKPENRVLDDKFGVWQMGAANVGHFTPDYFQQLAADADACVYLKQGDKLPRLKNDSAAVITPLIEGKTQAQTAILEQLDHWLNHPTQTAMLIKADRGRGKSRCLGFIAQALQRRADITLVVSAYSRLSAAVLLQQSDVEFIAPDELIKGKKTADVLIIDEAAMLPFALLRALVVRYKKVIMATTTGGYEGTGQGFLQRFLATFSPPQLLSLEIEAPVRWTREDYLEPCLNKVLRLKPELPVINRDIANADISYRIVDVKDCVDMALLKNIYDLMTLVHYRTRPSDLRMLMDNSDLSVVLAEADGHLVGVLVLNREGGFEPALSRQVYLGSRRPKGHLLAQMITAQASMEFFGCYRGMRIQRIAVLPSMRRRGVGQRLIDEASEYARHQKFDYIGACFAFDAELSQFWRHCQFLLVQVAFSQGKSSGNHSVAVLKPLSPKLDTTVAQLRARLQKQLPVWLTHYLSDMDVCSMVALLRISGFKAEQDALDRAEVVAFMDGFKGFELSYACVQLSVMNAIAASPEGTSVPSWLVEKAILNKPWAQLSGYDPAMGRKKAQQQLRNLMSDFQIKSTLFKA